MEFGIIGTSIWQQNMPLLELLTLDRDDKHDRLIQLKDALGISEMIYLATCNRVEFFYVNHEEDNRGNILHRLIDYFFADGTELNFFPNDFYHYTGKEAITHLFRTVASLESLVVGETQITGQFKDASLDALDHNLAGATLKKLSEEALLVAKKIKRETTLGEGAQSMASLASMELTEYFEGKTDLVFALVGAGSMTEKFAKYINKAKLGRLIFVNRSKDKAESLSETYGGSALSLEEFKSDPPKINSIISATAAKEPVFDFEFIQRLKETENIIMCVDLAIPGDFADDVSLHPNIKVIDIPFLKSKSQSNLRRKFIEASKANRIVKESVRKFLQDCLEGSIKPIFHNSYQESIELAKNAFSDLFKNKIKNLTPEEEIAIVNLVTKLIGNTVFQPARKLSQQLALNKQPFELEDIPVYTKEAI